MLLRQENHKRVQLSMYQARVAPSRESDARAMATRRLSESRCIGDHIECIHRRQMAAYQLQPWIRPAPKRPSIGRPVQTMFEPRPQDVQSLPLETSDLLSDTVNRGCESLESLA